MDDKTEVIRHNIHETRESLADKLETLEHQVVDTVQGTTNVVSNVKDAVQETVDQVKDSVQSTVESVKDTVQSTVETVRDTFQNTVDAVKDTVASAVEAVKNTFDVREHVHKYPWLMFGGSVVTGFVLGSTLPGVMRGGARSIGSLAGFMSAPRKNGAAKGNGKAPPPEQTPMARFSGEHMQSPAAAPSGILANEMNKLKAIALGTAAAVVREIIEGHMPGDLGKQLAALVSDVNSKLGGENIQGPILKRDSSHEGNGQAAASNDWRGDS